MAFYEDLIERNGLDGIVELEDRVFDSSMEYKTETSPKEPYEETARNDYGDFFKNAARFVSSPFMLPTVIRRVEENKSSSNHASYVFALLSTIISASAGGSIGIHMATEAGTTPVGLSLIPGLFSIQVLTCSVSGAYETARYVKKRAESRLEGKLNPRLEKEDGVL